MPPLRVRRSELVQLHVDLTVLAKFACGPPANECSPCATPLGKRTIVEADNNEGLKMGFMRKALFLGTGGLSGAAGIKANSKKERTAKAAEKQLRLQKQMLKAQQAATGQTTVRQTAAQPAAAPLYNVRCPSCSEMVRLPAGERLRCPKCKARMWVRPTVNQSAAIRQVPAKDTTTELERLATLHTSGALTDEEFAAAKAKVLTGGVQPVGAVCDDCGHTNTGQPRRCTKCGADL